MKKGIFIAGLLISAFLFAPTQQLDAQTSRSPWNGPRWASIPVTNAVSQWINDHGIFPDAEGEWYSTDYSYLGQGQWQVIITWGEGGIVGEGILGRATLIISSNGTIISEEIDQV